MPKSLCNICSETVMRGCVCIRTCVSVCACMCMYVYVHHYECVGWEYVFVFSFNNLSVYQLYQGILSRCGRELTFAVLLTTPCGNG